MIIDINIKLSDFSDADLDNSEVQKDAILIAALEAAGEAMLVLNERRMQRFIRFCNTGSFD